MTYKERYRIERKDEIAKTKRRVGYLCKVLTTVILITMFIALFCISALDTHPVITLLIAFNSLTIMVFCLVVGEKIACDDTDTLG